MHFIGYGISIIGINGNNIKSNIFAILNSMYTNKVCTLDYKFLILSFKVFISSKAACIENDPCAFDRSLDKENALRTIAQLRSLSIPEA